MRGHTAGTLDSWIQQHSNYNEIYLQVFGSWPDGVDDYWFNPYDGGGPSRQVQLVEVRATW